MLSYQYDGSVYKGLKLYVNTILLLSIKNCTFRKILI